jgi:hypothetical protein
MRSVRQHAAYLSAATLAFVVTGSGQMALAQEIGFEYAAKIVCGAQPEPKDTRLAPGFYATSVNIHNPNAGRVQLSKKLALTFPPGGQQPGEIRPIGEDLLGPDQALQSDCADIERRVFGGAFPAPNIEGFLIIQSTGSLDVTAVYTTATLPDAQHSSIHVEQIGERRQRVARADLVPVPNAAGDFCIRNENQLSVTVRNQGTAAAGASTTEVNFGTFGKSTMPTPALAPGASTTLVFTIPAGCFDPNCEFQITVDVSGQVPESNEANNVAKGVCLG